MRTTSVVFAIILVACSSTAPDQSAVWGSNDAGLTIAEEMIAEGLIGDPAWFQICLGVPWSTPATTHTMKAIADALPAGCLWSGFGLSRMEMPMVAQAMLLGGNVRVGLEDNLYLAKGVPATNAELVERAIAIIGYLGGRAVSPDEARKKLGLH